MILDILFWVVALTIIIFVGVQMYNAPPTPPGQKQPCVITVVPVIIVSGDC